VIGRNDLARLMAAGLVSPAMSRPSDSGATDWMLGLGNAPVREPLTRDIFRQDRPALTHEPMEAAQDRAMQKYFRRPRESGSWRPQLETVPGRLPLPPLPGRLP
jgi:hypothetical protein